MVKHPDQTVNLDSHANGGFEIKEDVSEAVQSYIDKINSSDLTSIMNHQVDTGSHKTRSNLSTRTDTSDEGSEQSDSDADYTPNRRKKAERKKPKPRKYVKRAQKFDSDCVGERGEREEKRLLLDLENCGLKRRPSSIIWQFMIKQSPVQATCTLCRKSFRVHNGSTSSMIKHLKIFHSGAMAKAEGENGMAVSQPKLKPKSFPPLLKHPVSFSPHETKTIAGYSGAKHQDHLVNTMVQNLIPCSLVESESFKKYICTLNPNALVPTKKNIEDYVSKLHKRHQSLLQRELDEAPGISVSLELWMYKERRQYMTVTVHFVSKTWELRSSVLKTVLINTRRSTDLGLDVAEKLDQILRDWNILDKVTCVVTDESGHLVSAVTRLDKPHIHCIAHALDTMVKTSLTALRDFGSVTERVRDIADFFYHCVEASDKLCEIHTAAGRTAQTLTLDTATDWVSTYKMLRSYLDLEDTFRLVLDQLGKGEILLGPEEAVFLRRCTQVLEPFVLAAEDMASDGFTALSKSLPVFEILQQMVLNSQVCPDSSVEDDDPLSVLTQELSRHLDQILRHNVRNRTNLLSFTATLLDPRFKHIVVRDSQILERVEDMLQPLMGSEASVEKDNIKMEYTASAAISDLESSSLWSTFDNTVKKSVSEKPVNELHRYVEERSVTRQENPLLYWKEREPLYPKLSNIVKKFLSIPGTSVPSKQVFSEEVKKNLIRRTFLEESSVDSILFLSSCEVVL